MAVQQDVRRERLPLDSLAVLRVHPVFGEIDPPLLGRLGAYTRTRKVAAGTKIFTKGDPGTALFAVGTGSVKIAVPSADGREATFNLLHAGEIFGEIALLDGRPRTADAIAMTDCELMVIERRDFLSFLNSEPGVAMKLIELLCGRLRWVSGQLEEVIFLDLPARLARILLRLADQKASESRADKLKITQLEISQMLGSARESVNKVLRAWADRKWISLERGGIIVLRRDGLEATAAASVAEANGGEASAASPSAPNDARPARRPLGGRSGKS